jgi:hypothetical protein
VSPDILPFPTFGDIWRLLAARGPVKLLSMAEYESSKCSANPEHSHKGSYKNQHRGSRRRAVENHFNNLVRVRYENDKDQGNAKSRAHYKMVG